MASGHEVSLEFQEYGDAGVLVQVQSDDYESAWSLTQRIGESLRAKTPPGLTDVVASYRDVFVSFDPLTLDHETVCTLVSERALSEATGREPRHREVPVVYGGHHGPDLDDLARSLGLTPAELVELHTSAAWTVRFVGSPAAAPLMDGPRVPTSVPRLTVPRARVEPGSVALSGFQCIIYNAPSPGGWQVIGRTPLVFFDLERPPHLPYRAGETMQFRAVPAEQWDTIRQRGLP